MNILYPMYVSNECILFLMTYPVSNNLALSSFYIESRKPRTDGKRIADYIWLITLIIIYNEATIHHISFSYPFSIPSFCYPFRVFGSAAAVAY